MSSYEILAAGGLAAVLIALGLIASGRLSGGDALAAAMLAGAFAGFTAITVFKEGALLVWANHTTSLWGVQVWWDLLIAVTLAVFFIVPRARAAGMNVLPWIVFVALTASIGLLAMVARLFWLEKQAATS
ncbi:hypothetical protein [Qipengyuania soli]|uniref:DUF2834 domain-containing protein n=1 Tax=Qipengyuania soli TaxID=2782568 RepID=A0A7S8IU19_9SPHN|nr:hypothetical protein [Qipengyuania soli]QPC97830.1 hypothetical protein IRL76_07920 [Qipengyuania soli]